MLNYEKNVELAAKLAHIEFDGRILNFSSFWKKCWNWGITDQLNDYIFSISQIQAHYLYMCDQPSQYDYGCLFNRESFWTATEMIGSLRNIFSYDFEIVKTDHKELFSNIDYFITCANQTIDNVPGHMMVEHHTHTTMTYLIHLGANDQEEFRSIAEPIRHLSNSISCLRGMSSIIKDLLKTAI